MPARQSAQSSALSEPVAAASLPTPHLIHADVADVEYCPAGHAVHVVPADDTGDDKEPLSSAVTIEPSAQLSHVLEACLLLYCPGPHAMHSETLLDMRAVPNLPASQLSHWPCALLTWYLPDGHSMQPVPSAPRSPAPALPYLPAQHSLHADAPS